MLDSCTPNTISISPPFTHAPWLFPWIWLFLESKSQCFPKPGKPRVGEFNKYKDKHISSVYINIKFIFLHINICSSIHLYTNHLLNHLPSPHPPLYKISNSWATANAKAMGLLLDAMTRRRPNVRTTVASAVPRGEAPGSEQVVDTEEAREGSWVEEGKMRSFVV